MMERSYPPINEESRRKVDGELESATRTAETRVRQQLSWLSSLPADFTTVLDIGAGAGHHSKYFLELGKRPTALERYAEAFLFNKEIPLITKDLFEFEPSELFDAVFCSHVLEHFPDPALAIKKMRSLIRPEGYLLVVVPPYQPMVVNFHWHTGWNCTQLAMLLAACGFDCSEATFVQVEDNICGWGRKRDLPDTKFNLRRSLPFLPAGMSRTFFMKDGYEFMSGRVTFADPHTAKIKGDAARFPVPAFSFDDARSLTFGEQSWQAAEARFPQARLNFVGEYLSLFVALEGEAPALRIALGHGTPDDPWQNCAEHYLNATAGMNCFQLTPGDFSQLRGEVDFAQIEAVSIGGFGTNAQVRLWCYRADGCSIFD